MWSHTKGAVGGRISLKSRQRVWGSAVSSPRGVWGGAPAEIESEGAAGAERAGAD